MFVFWCPNIFQIVTTQVWLCQNHSATNIMDLSMVFDGTGPGNYREPYLSRRPFPHTVRSFSDTFLGLPKFEICHKQLMFNGLCHMAQALKTDGRATLIFHQKTRAMKNTILSFLFATLSCFVFLPNIGAQESFASTRIQIETNGDGPVKRFSVSESGTDNSYQMNLRFSKKNTAQIKSYLAGLLGNADLEVGTVRQVWKHMPDGAIIEGLEITLREGRFSINAKDGCCPGDMDELKAISEDIISMLE